MLSLLICLSFPKANTWWYAWIPVPITVTDVEDLEAIKSVIMAPAAAVLKSVIIPLSFKMAAGNPVLPSKRKIAPL